MTHISTTTAAVGPHERPASITISPVHVADLLAEGERMRVYVYIIDHPDARARFEPDRGNLS